MSASTNDLQLAVKKALRASAKPMVSSDIFAIPSVNKQTKSVLSVANCLAMLWREGQLTRVRAHNDLMEDRKVRWAYAWKQQVIAHSRVDEKLGLPTVCIEGTDMDNARNSNSGWLSNISESVGENSSWSRYMAILKTNI